MFSFQGTKPSQPPQETELERYYREMQERQVGENKPDYDPWTGGYY